MLYSVNSELSQKVCEQIGWSFEIKAIETAVLRNKIHVRGTALKPDEARHLCNFCVYNGYVYHGPFPR